MFETQLKEKKLKVTPQRIAILKEIHKNGHISIEEIYENIKREYPSISLATIYKNIASMFEANLLREVKIPCHKQRYELAYDKHVHITCEKCGKIEDMHLELEKLIAECSSATGYQINNVSMVFMGICSTCSNNQKL
ncbi:MULTISPECIES: Fur family transcriptional regulator [unclassified Helicobacter]|uniref:Fur family transcriptional regulator n=1 Tax=unclassified Helicobacter TaxID=2593540 RepID=UPI000CF1432F|nr:MULTISPECIES: transcriptional repressor [unclassified Helicobacter]